MPCRESSDITMFQGDIESASRQRDPPAGEPTVGMLVLVQGVVVAQTG